MADAAPHRWQAATVVAVAVVAVVAAMWWSTRSDLADARRALDATVAEDERGGPDLEVEVRDALSYDAAVELADDDFVTIRYTYLSEDDEVELRNLLDDLGFEDDIMDRIGASRSVDGTLAAEGDGVEARWIYHPEEGLRMVLRRV